MWHRVGPRLVVMVSSTRPIEILPYTWSWACLDKRHLLPLDRMVMHHRCGAKHTEQYPDDEEWYANDDPPS